MTRALRPHRLMSDGREDALDGSVVSCRMNTGSIRRIQHTRTRLGSRCAEHELLTALSGAFGAHILAPEGADSIQTAALAIRQALTVDDLADTILSVSYHGRRAEPRSARICQRRSEAIMLCWLKVTFT